MKPFAALVVAAGLAVTPSLANDTMSTLGAGGLVFVQTDDVKMLSEDLYVSPEQVRVKYEFRNEGAEDTDALVAFPMPDITGDGDFMVAIPTEDPQNIFGFQTLVNGEPVSAELHQYVFATNIDYTQYLTDLGLPLTPYGEATVTAINALDEATKKELLHRALVIPMEFDQGQGMQTEYWPVWTLRSTYSWEAHFPAGKTVVVEHQYKPSLRRATTAPPSTSRNTAPTTASSLRWKRRCLILPSATGRRSPKAGSAISGRPAPTGRERSATST